MSVSIIVPVYNAEMFIHQCFDSIRQQTYGEFEVIAVDDGSTDRSGAICDEYALMDKRFKVVHKFNGGVSSARNIGIDNADGEWIAFIDSDDYVSPTYLENLVLYSDFDLVIGGYRTFPTKHSVQLPNESFSSQNIGMFIDRHLTRLYYVTPWGKLYRRCIVKRYNLKFDFSIRFSEDMLFNLQYLLYCSSIKLIPCSNYFYYEGTTLAAEKYNLQLGELHEIINKLCNSFDELKQKYHLLLDYDSLNLNAIIACYPLAKIYQYQSDEEYFEFYKSVMGIGDKELFYSDWHCSPILRTLYTLKKAYTEKQYKKGKMLIRQFSSYYGKKKVKIKNLNLLHKFLYTVLRYRLYMMAEFSLYLYACIKRIVK